MAPWLEDTPQQDEQAELMLPPSIDPAIAEQPVEQEIAHEVDPVGCAYIDHYNQHRPHQLLDQRPPTPLHQPPEAPTATITVVQSTDATVSLNDYRNVT